MHDRRRLHFLMNQTSRSWGNLSSHRSKLEKAGYVHIEKEFLDKNPRTMVNLTEAGRAASQRYRQQIQRFMHGF